MNRLALYKTLFLTSVFLLYCFNLFQTVSPLAIFGIRSRNNSTVKNAHEKLGDIKDFRFLINPNVCENCNDDFLLILTVFSALENYERRNVIRKSWGKQWKCSIQTVFLTGTTYNDTINDKILIESALHGDIVQGNFIDTYRNLTYKHVMDLKWVTNYCAKAKYVIKVDDDVTLMTRQIHDKLEGNYWGNTGLMACASVENTSVIRDDHKWAVSKHEFADEKYPDYCDGPLVIYSKDVVPRLLQESTKVPFFRIDDVYVTGILAKRIGVKPLNVRTINNVSAGYWIPFNAESEAMDFHAKVLSQSMTVDSNLMYKHWKSIFEIDRVNSFTSN